MRDLFGPGEDEDDDGEEDASELVLVFNAAGQCVLEEDGETVWTSDSDDDFQEEFGNEFLDADSDGARILNWLEEEGWLEEEEKASVAIETDTDVDGEEESDG